MLSPMCRASATLACLAVHATHARAVVAAEAAAAKAMTTTTTTARWAHMLTLEAAWACEAEAETILKIAGDADGCDDHNDASVDGSIIIEGDAGGGDGGYGESGTSCPDGTDLDLGGRDACGNDGNGGEDGSMGL
jgi:hypothetical protein